LTRALSGDVISDYVAGVVVTVNVALTEPADVVTAILLCPPSAEIPLERRVPSGTENVTRFPRASTVARIGVDFVGIDPWAPGSHALAQPTDACCRFAP
jgi:hypothetical protein